VKAGSLTGGINGNPSQAVDLQAGVEVTTSSAYNNASATNLDWESLSAEWHYSDWASHSSHAEIWCDPYTAASWDTEYDTFGFGVNWEGTCTGTKESVKADGSEASSATPPSLPSLPVSSTATTATALNTIGTLTTAQLRTKAIAISTLLGESTPTIEAAEGTRAATVAAATPAFWFSETTAQQDWLNGATDAVVLHGNFSVPGTSIDGTTLSLVLDAKTGAVTAFDLATASQQQPDLAQLGTVKQL
jgi:hypothetical protein